MDEGRGCGVSGREKDDEAARAAEEAFAFHPPERLRGRIWPWLRPWVNRLGAAGMALATGGYSWLVSPFQVEFTEVRMPLRGLGRAFEGFRIVQMSDLHVRRNTPAGYLREVIKRINGMECDLVCVTGDIVSSRMKGVGAACELLGELRKPTVVSLGNHDYSQRGHTWQGTEIAEALEAGLKGRDVRVLRNGSMAVERGGSRVWVVGMEDYWSALFSARQAFAGIEEGEPIIALSHNPDTVYALEYFGAQWVLSGHTHGGQIRLPYVEPLVLPMRSKQFDQGLFRVGNSRLYVNRGVGFRLQVRFRCRPEVTSFVLEGEGC